MRTTACSVALFCFCATLNSLGCKDIAREGNLTEHGNSSGDGDGDVGTDDGDGDGDSPSKPDDPRDNLPKGAGLPCDVASILEQRCWTCHGKMPEGAPMSLTSWEDFHAEAESDSERSVFELVKERIHDQKKPMPPRTRDPLDAAQLTKLDAWLAKGAPQSFGTCGTLDEPVDAGSTGFDPAECETWIEVRAHNGQTPDDKTPFEVEPGENYECFYVTVPFDKKHQAIEVEPIIDNGKVLHHYLLYQDEETGEGNGTHKGCSGLHPSQTLLSGWAPGNKGPDLPKDVGLYLPRGPNARFNLEIHYNNAGSGNQLDRSGARICATSKLRPKEAAQHWLGTEAILLGPGRGTAGSDCRPTQEAHILRVSPHMHKLGVHMTTQITRKNGTKEMLTDRAFAFEDQQVYPVEGGEVVVGPGDVLRTTCVYENPGGLVGFGPGTAEEMCYNFVTAWPVGSLGTGGGLGVSKSTQTCMR